MPETNHENQLGEIEKLEKELAERKAALENLNGEKGILEKQPEQKEDEQRYRIEKKPTVTGQSTVQPQIQPQVKPIKKTVADFKNLDKDHQVKILATVAFEEGITKAVDLARRLNDAYVLDELHDRLVGELYERLVKEGKLKKI